MQHRYFALHKPNNMVSQFVSSHKVNLLTKIDFPWPEGTHAIGRLDINSEGLLILTTNKKVTKLLFESKIPHKRTYLVQVRHEVTAEELKQLQNGVPIRIEGGIDYITQPCEASIVHDPEKYFNYIPPDKSYGIHTWLLITLTQGKFRQVRKMVSAIRHPCKRLIRVSIEDLELGQQKAGEVRELEEEEFFRLLKIENWQ